MRAALRTFEMGELEAALDDARRAQGLTWGLDGRNQQSLRGHALHTISLSTIRGMQNKRSVTSAVVLEILRWLPDTGDFLGGFLGGQQRLSTSE
jgi:hypothetical protein